MTHKGQSSVKTIKVDANVHLGTLTTKITECLGEYKKSPNEKNKQHNRKKLAAAVAEAMNFIAQAMHEGVFKNDPTGLMITDSTFEDPVNEIAKEWLAKLQKANPDDEIGAANRLALQHAEATGIQKLILMTKHGVQIIWDGIKRGVMFVYNKAVQFFKWVWNGIQSMWQWLKEKFTSFLGKAANDEPELKEIDMAKILQEGEESLTVNYGEKNDAKEAEQAIPKAT
ncbi:hypothetical protein [uncultured Flavobacterium sp.]|uniref:hypothetical protein n=1 Tax=uncultured Flavobacterium sp. TaxID=165435 RepID=UPI00259ACFA9|nr:hypothetical protein [uncultured Flavobacterium sp.]